MGERRCCSWMQPECWLRIIPLLVLLLLVSWVGAANVLAADGNNHPVSHHPEVQPDEYERLLLQGLDAIRNSRMDVALEAFKQLTTEKPDFRLAQLIYGDLLLSRAGLLRKFGNAPAQSQEDVDSLLDEARTRIRYLFQTIPGPNVMPELLIQLAEWQEHAIVVDLDKSRLYLFRHGLEQDQPVLLADYYISSGKFGVDKFRKGDKKTPIGLYHITEHLLGQKLPNFYGAGALPLNYPNEWDKLLKKTGYGIWLHGSPVDTYSRPPRASDGCVALTNSDFRILQAMAAIGTPVILAESLHWMDRQNWLQRQQEFLALVQQWKDDWSSRKVNRVIRHYSRNFRNARHNLTSWTKELTFMMVDRPLRDLTTGDISVIGYPNQGSSNSLVVVTFPVEGGVGKDKLSRRQYWQKEENNTWRIVFEDVLLG